MDGCHWVPFNFTMTMGSLVIVSSDSDGGALCVARGNHSGELIPGKGVLRYGKCHVSHHGKEHVLTNFEVLMNDGKYQWKESSNGQVPSNAVIGGRTADGQTTYVGRAKHLNFSVPGKVHPSHQCLYLSFNSKEHAKKNYEVLVRNVQPKTGILKSATTSTTDVSWVKNRPWPSNAARAGVHIENGQRRIQYIARMRNNSSTVIGYAYENGHFCGILNGKEVKSSDFEVLVENHPGAFPNERI